MEIKHEEDGTWTVSKMTDEDMRTFYFGIYDYQTRMIKEQATGMMGGEHMTQEDYDFLSETIPRVSATMDKIQGQQHAFQELL